MTNNYGLFKMKEEKKLTELRWFWASLLGPVAISLLLILFIQQNSNLVWNCSYTGFNYALEIFKFPLGVAALAFPFVALVVSNHRSSQSALTLKRSYEQVTFANYYKHQEEFFKLLDKLEEKLKIEFIGPYRLYEMLFPANSVTNMKTVSYCKNGGTPTLMLLAEKYRNVMQEIEGEKSLNEDIICSHYFELKVLSEQLMFKVLDGYLIDNTNFLKDSKYRYFIHYEKKNPYYHSHVVLNVLEGLGQYSNLKVDKYCTMYGASEEFKEAVKTFFPYANDDESRGVASLRVENKYPVDILEIVNESEFSAYNIILKVERINMRGIVNESLPTNTLMPKSSMPVPYSSVSCNLGVDVTLQWTNNNGTEAKIEFRWTKNMLYSQSLTPS